MKPAIVVCTNPVKAQEITIIRVSGKVEYDNNSPGNEIIQKKRPNSIPFSLLNLPLNTCFVGDHVNAIMRDKANGCAKKNHILGSDQGRNRHGFLY